jgi:hypothetical protein
MEQEAEKFEQKTNTNKNSSWDYLNYSKKIKNDI